MEQATNGAAVIQAGGKRLEETKKHTGVRIFLVFFGLLLAAYLGLCTYASLSNVLFSGITVSNQEIGGLSVGQAEQALGDNNTWPGDTNVQLFPTTFEDPQMGLPESSPVELTFSDFGGVEMDAAASAEAAWDYCHGSNFFLRGWRFLKSVIGMADLPPVLTAPRLSEVASDLAERLSQPVVEGSHTLQTDTIAVTVPRDGYTIAAADLEKAVSDALAACEYMSVSCPGTPLPSTPLTAQEIALAYAGEMKNAGYDSTTDSYIPEQSHAEFDVSAAQVTLDQAVPGSTVEIYADVQTPDVTVESLKAVLFRDLLGECTTKVGGSGARKNNVRLAASAFDNYVMNHGDVFSYNGVVGKRTTAKGYQAAPAYVKGETVDEIGGGVCQPSSTLYLACLRADLEITERYAHRYIPAYIPAGMDATVSWGGPDYKFTNNTGYPIRIDTSYANNKLTIKIFGTNVEGTSVKITNKHLSTTPFKEVFEDDPTLAPGTTKVKTTPYTGHKYQTFRNRYDKDGKLISSTFEASSDYKARDRVILRGPALTKPDAPSVLPLPDSPHPPASETVPENPLPLLPEIPPVTPSEPTETIPQPEAPEFIVVEP